MLLALGLRAQIAGNDVLDTADKLRIEPLGVNGTLTELSVTWLCRSVFVYRNFGRLSR